MITFTQLNALFSAIENIQKLFIRLYLRKHDWIFKKKIQYDEIDNIDACLEALVAEDLLGRMATCN